MEQLKSASQNAESPARRLQNFTKKRRRINQSKIFSERDDKLTGASKFPPVALNGTPSVEADDEPRAAQPQSSPPQPKHLDEVNVLPKEDEKSPPFSTLPPVLSNENPSLETDHLPAAQLVPPNSVINGSGPSTSVNLLETDRGTILYPSTGDSTQAAIQKAMRSLQEDGFTPLKSLTTHAPNQGTPSAGKRLHKHTHSVIPAVPTIAESDEQENKMKSQPPSQQLDKGLDGTVFTPAKMEQTTEIDECI